MPKDILMKTQPRVAVIVLNYNGGELNIRCLDSLLNQGGTCISVIFVDNGSVDGSLETVRDTYQDVHIIDNGTNLYFAEGNNVGIRWAMDNNFEYIFVLNNDTVVEDECLVHLLAFMEKRQDVAACQPILSYMHRPDIVASAGCMLCISGKGADVDCGKTVATVVEQGKRDVLGVTGGAMFLRNEALQQVGLFDETFQMYLEDIDLSLRLREAGWNLCLVPEARVRHTVSATTDNVGDWKKVYFCERNSYKIVLNNFPPQQIIKAYALSLPAAMAAAGSGLIRGRFRHAYGIMRAMFEGIVQLCSTLPGRLTENKTRNYPFWSWIHTWTCYPPACIRPENTYMEPEKPNSPLV